MKKRKLIFALGCMVALLTGCGAKDQPKEIPMEDYVRENPQNSAFGCVMKTEDGYYYNSSAARGLSLHYYDMKSGQNIFLCNRPECSHEGDVFCTATNDSYTVLYTYMYGDLIYITVIEETDGQETIKLLAASLDGTSLTEVATLMSLNETSLRPWIYTFSERGMIIHRGKVIFNYDLVNYDNIDIYESGTIIYDLVTGEKTTLLEGQNGEECEPSNRFRAYGDGLYYVTQYGKKRILTRYDLVDGTSEDFKLLVNFTGEYEVLDEETIVYARKGSSLCTYHRATGENIEHKDLLKTTVSMTWTDEDGNIHSFTDDYDYECSDLLTDGTYIYVARFAYFGGYGVNSSDLVPEGATNMNAPRIQVFDRNFKEVASVEIYPNEVLGHKNYFSIHIYEDQVYLMSGVAVYSCPKEEFLRGEANFSKLYDVLADCFDWRDFYSIEEEN